MYDFNLKLITEPSEEPISVALVRQWCRIDDTVEDDLISLQITAARQYLEKAYGRAFVTQTWDVYYEEFDDCFTLPWGKLQSVSAFEYTDSAGTTTTYTISGSNILSGSTTVAHIDTVGEPAEIELAYGQQWPTPTLKTVNPIRIRIVCGYGAATAVPSPIKIAIALLAGTWSLNRESIIVSDRTSASAVELPHGVAALMEPFNLHWTD